MIDETEDNAEDAGEDIKEALELDTQSRIFLEMRAQNLELLKIAAKVVGFGGNHNPVKPGDLKHVMKGIWEAYAEFYSWIDPEETGEDDEDDDE